VPDPTFRILTVCVGNICRSPLAERLLGARLGDGYDVASAGTRGVVGSAMEPLAAAELERLGGSADGFHARRLEPAHLAEADLVLTATRDVRRDALGVGPRAMRRTFTLGELAAICTAAGGELPRDATALVAYAAAHRHLAAPDVQDVRDPIGRNAAVHREVADAIDQHVAVLVRALAPSAGHVG
jgi:protein-tyrosine phosphatase